MPPHFARAAVIDQTFERLPQTSALRPVIGPSGLQIAPPRLGAALPPPCITAVLRPGRPTLSGDAAYPQLAPVLDSSSHLRPYFARPGYYFNAPGGLPSHDALLWRPYGAVGVLPLGPGARAQGLIDASSLQARLSFGAGPALRAGPILAVGEGYLFAGASVTHLQGQLLSTVNAGLVLWRGSVGVTGRLAQINLQTGLFYMVGASASRSMERELLDLGCYTGEGAAAVAAALQQAPQQPLRRLELRRRRAWAGSLYLGGGHLALALQSRVGLSQRQESVYRTHLGQAAAQRLLCEPPGLRSFWRRQARTWGLRAEALEVPSHLSPQRLSLGDELTYTRSRTLVLGLTLGNLAVWPGVQVIVQNDREYRLRRLSDRLVELVVTPTAVRSRGAFVASALGPQVSYDVCRARSLRESFLFDTTQPAARSALQQLLRGEVGPAPDGRAPGAAEAHLVGPKAATPPAAAAPGGALGPAAGTAVAPLPSPSAEAPLGPTEGLPWQLQQLGQRSCFAAAMPPGVRRTYVHAIVARQWRRGGGVHLYTVPRALLPRGWEPGLVHHRVRGAEDQLVLQNGAHLLVRSCGAERRSELLWRGLRSQRVAATTHAVAQRSGQQDLQSLQLDCVIGRSRQSLRDTNRQVIGRLNQYFDLKLQSLQPPASLRGREIALGRLLQPAQIDAIAADQGPKGPLGLPVWRRLQLYNVAHATLVPHRFVRRYVASMAATSGLDGRARLTQRFVQRHEIRGFAAVHRLCGQGGAALTLEAVTQSYAETIKHAGHVQLQWYDGAPTGRAFAQVAEALQRLRDGRAKLLGDPLISAQQRSSLSRQLADAQLSLLVILRLPPQGAAQKA